ncbi:MAG: hypothetical protein J0L75_11400 [Spirochaetes bacterium]|nr:hypothetical protein [Spirochaetota bacterium]
MEANTLHPNASPRRPGRIWGKFSLAAMVLAAGLCAQGGVSLLPDDPYPLFLASMGGGKSSLVPVEGKAFGKALRIAVAEKPANHWDVQFVVKSAAAAPAGSTLAFWFSARSRKGDGHLLATLKDKAGKAVFRKEFTPGSAWSDEVVGGPLAAAVQAGELTLILTFGWQVQEIELGGLALLALEAGTKVEGLPLPPQARVTASGAAGVPAPAQVAMAEAEEELPPLPGGVRRFAIFKWDDLTGRPDGVPPPFQRVADFVASNKMHASLGIICNSLEKPSEAYCQWIKKRAVENGGPFEFWFHGWDHLMTTSNGRSYTEFSGPDYGSQKTHFEWGVAALKEKTGLAFRSFGSAGNQYDATSVKVFEEFPEVKVWLFGDPKAGSTKFLIPRLVEGERGAGRPDYANFMKGYRSKRTAEALLIQGHPGGWSDAHFGEFVKIHARLVKDGWEFATPYEYYQYKSNERP